MANELTSTQRQTLKGRAHTLDPVVMVGNAGVTPAVLGEVRLALDSHELIKIRVMGSDRHERERILGELCSATGAAPVQHIGKIIVIYRERVVEPEPKAPPRAARPAKRTRSPRAGIRARVSAQPSSPARRGKLRPR